MSLRESHRHTARQRPPWLHDLDLVRQGNIALCANALRTLGVGTISEVANYTDLSRPTVKERLLNLVDLGLAKQVGLSTSTRASSGRPANRFAFNAQAAYIVGVELTRFNERVLVCDVEGKIVRRHDSNFETNLSGEERITHLIDVLDEIVKDLNESHGTCLGIGIALPGIISLKEGVRKSPLFPDHETIDVAERFSSHFGVPVMLENDINAAALAESIIGASKGARSSAYIYTWHELAAGLMINGRMHRGVNNAAGEINLLQPDVPLNQQPEAWLSVSNAIAGFARAAAGDDQAKIDMDSFLDKTAKQIAAFGLAIDPEVIVLGGSLAMDEKVVQDLKARVRDSLRIDFDLRIERTKLGVDSPALGVLHLAFTAAIADVFGEKNAAMPVPTFGANREKASPSTY